MIAKTALGVAAAVFAASALEKVAGTLGLVASILVAFAVIFTSGRAIWRFLRRLERVVENTEALPAFMAEQRETNVEVQARLTQENARVHERLDAGAEKMAAIVEVLGTLATSERAAVRGAIDAIQAPRPPRSTDPDARTGWRE